ncbi:MAG TPA: peptide chain release factor 2 [Chloroflexi bacterium]|nr:peptide chain release factor 2 [Chloroflexota bacterium]
MLASRASWSAFDITNKEQQLAELEQHSLQPGFWDDSQTAQNVMRRLARLRHEVEGWQALERRAREVRELIELAELEEDVGLEAELTVEVAALEQDLGAREFQLAFSSEHDRGDALLSVHAGAGGTESQDWADMLLRMYLRWAEQHGYQTEILDLTEGEEAGIKSVTVQISGEYAYGYLRAEKGVHRLVRISPFDAQSRRHTSFALVEVMPVIEDDVEIHIDPEDIKMDVFRAGGHGGQHMQKNSTAVRLTHIPTGIIVTCQNERSQVQNRETALKVLRGRLYELGQERLEEEQARIKGAHTSAEWGNQIRSYVLHPYQMVKDHRTDVETGNTAAVLDGDLDDFIQAWLKSQVGE